jgi:hypothetical protein
MRIIAQMTDGKHYQLDDYYLDDCSSETQCLQEIYNYARENLNTVKTIDNAHLVLGYVIKFEFLGEWK